MRVQYGENFEYQPPLKGLYGYKVGNGNIVFHVNDGYVTSATVS